jgi:hypothetical protein
MTRQPGASAVAGEMPAAVDGAEARDKEQQTTADESPTHTGVNLPSFDDSGPQTQENTGLRERQSPLAPQTRGSLASYAAPQRTSGAKRKFDPNAPERNHEKTTKHEIAIRKVRSQLHTLEGEISKSWKRATSDDDDHTVA